MPQMKENMDQQPLHQATVMETKLDSICLALGKMKTALQRDQTLAHMTEKERAELEVALARAEERLNELSTVIRGGA